jgi:hypothetical protein
LTLFVCQVSSRECSRVRRRDWKIDREESARKIFLFYFQALSVPAKGTESPCVCELSAFKHCDFYEVIICGIDFNHNEAPSIAIWQWKYLVFVVQFAIIHGFLQR